MQANQPGVFKGEAAGEDAVTRSILCVVWVATNQKAPEGEQMEDPAQESVFYGSQHTETSRPRNWNKLGPFTYSLLHEGMLRFMQMSKYVHR